MHKGFKGNDVCTQWTQKTKAQISHNVEDNIQLGTSALLIVFLNLDH